jgi:hypothetical protein
MTDVCKNGHLKTPDNVDARNRCKICYHISCKRWRDKNRDKKNKDSNDYYYNNKEKVKLTIERARLKRQYGITVDDYNEMVSAQQNVCDICGKQETERSNKLSIDHNHATGLVRKLLCHKCNRGIGSFDENVETLQNAIDYLNKHNEKEI